MLQDKQSAPAEDLIFNRKTSLFGRYFLTLLTLQSVSKYQTVTFKSLLSAIVMSLCLLLLTGANFVVYPPGGSDYAAYEMQDAPAPVEEKNTETKNLTNIQEEYLHDHNHQHGIYFNTITLHKIHAAESLPFVALEKRYQPPKV